MAKVTEDFLTHFYYGIRDDYLERIRGLGVSPRRINEIIHGKRSVTADTALRLAHYFGNSPQFWLGLQMDYDLDVETDRLSHSIKREVKKLVYT